MLYQITKYYTELYTVQATTSESEIRAYLDDIALAWLSDSDREYFCHHITKDEITDAINSLPNKAPGLRGLPGEFYKEYQDILIPHLAEMLEEAYEEGTLQTH